MDELIPAIITIFNFFKYLKIVARPGGVRVSFKLARQSSIIKIDSSGLV